MHGRVTKRGETSKDDAVGEGFSKVQQLSESGVCSVSARRVRCSNLMTPDRSYALAP